MQKTDNKAEIKEKYAYIYKIFKKEYERCLKEIGNKGEDIAKTDNLGLFARFSQIHNVARAMESNELKVKDIVFMILQLKSRFKTIAKREILIDNANINHRERYTLVKKSILEELEVLYSILFDLAQMTDLPKQEGGDDDDGDDAAAMAKKMVPKDEAEAKAQNDAATTLQAKQRGRKAREKVEAMKKDAEKAAEKAAVAKEMAPENEAEAKAREKVETMREEKKEAPDDAAAAEGEGETAIHKAIKEQLPSDLLYKIIMEKQNRKLINIRDKDGWTPLHYAAYQNLGKDKIKVLLKAGAETGAVNDENKKPSAVATVPEDFLKNLGDAQAEIQKEKKDETKSTNSNDIQSTAATTPAPVAGAEESDDADATGR